MEIHGRCRPLQASERHANVACDKPSLAIQQCAHQQKGGGRFVPCAVMEVVSVAQTKRRFSRAFMLADAPQKKKVKVLTASAQVVRLASWSSTYATTPSEFLAQKIFRVGNRNRSIKLGCERNSEETNCSADRTITMNILHFSGAAQLQTAA